MFSPHTYSHQYENEQIAKLPLHSFLGGVMLQATGVCPADLLKTASVKKVFDGGKWLCGASRLKAMVAEGRRPVVCKLPN